MPPVKGKSQSEKLDFTPLYGILREAQAPKNTTTLVNRVPFLSISLAIGNAMNIGPEGSVPKKNKDIIIP